MISKCEYEFITNQGLKANIEIQESARKDGELIVVRLDLNGKNIYTAKKGNYGEVKLAAPYDKDHNKVFALAVKGNACKDFMKISKIKANVKSAYIQVDNKELEKLYYELPKLRKFNEEERANIYFEECRKNNTKITFWKCGDTFNTSSSLAYSTEFKKMKDIIGKYAKSEDLLYYLTSTNWGDYSITNYYELTINELLDIYNKANNTKLGHDRKLKEKEEKLDAERKAIFEKARITGEKQLLSKTTCECNNPREECNLDILYLYALPNGETEEIRTHTW